MFPQSSKVNIDSKHALDTCKPDNNKKGPQHYRHMLHALHMGRETQRFGKRVIE